MLKRCAKLLGLTRQDDKDSRKKKEFGGASVTLDLTLQSREVSAQVVHAGGRAELYQNTVSVSQLMEKYPGMCVARPEVFKNPNESFLWPEENLLLGQKYYMIPSTTAQKLKHKHMKKSRVKGPAEDEVDMSEPRITWEMRGDNKDEFFRSASEFYISGEKWPGRVKKKGVKKKKSFVPPLPNGRMFQVFRWEPSLTSVQELSP